MDPSNRDRMLAGIGFTMSIFISNLAFSDHNMIQSSKIAVLAGSLLSSVSGLVLLYFAVRKKRQEI
jgi:NhaA family Na+:H+ antiporter